MPTNVRDPRTIITPSAFRLDAELLGTPLASPWKRLGAIVLDLVVVGLLTVFLDSIQLLVWGVVALFFLRVAFKRRGTADPAGAILLRVSAGCLGVTILSAVLIAWLVFQLASDVDRPGGSAGRSAAGVAASGGLGDLEELLDGLAEVSRLRSADSDDEAEDAAVAVLEASRSVTGMDDDTRMELLEDLTPADARWTSEADEIYERALERFREEQATPGESGESGDVALGDLSDDEAFDAYADLLRASGAEAAAADTGEAALRAAALRRRLSGVVAADTLEALEDRLGSVARERDRARRDLATAEQALESGGNDFAALLRDVWDQLGSAIGLWSIYFTVLTTVFAGQTVGKRAFGLQVVRLDGEPMTWWTSFERAGGYVAGLATGLLGFAQVFWDPNRQCIHDKIVGTVVVRHGAPPVPGAWQEARGTLINGGDSS